MDGARWVVDSIVVDGDGDGDDDVQVVDGGGWRRWWCSRAPSRALYHTVLLPWSWCCFLIASSVTVGCNKSNGSI